MKKPFILSEYLESFHVVNERLFTSRIFELSQDFSYLEQFNIVNVLATLYRVIADLDINMRVILRRHLLQNFL